MPDSLVVQAARRFSREFSLREDHTLSALSEQWAASERRLSAQIDALAAQIAERRATGLSVTDGAIVRLERYQDLLLQLEEEWTSFAPRATALLDYRRLAEAEQGLRDSQFALQVSQEEAGLRVGFDRLNVEQARFILGSMLDDPLGTLLSGALGETLPAVRQRIFQAAALGHNPRKLAREIVSASRMPLQRAFLIARTESIRAYREASRLQYEQSGIVKAYKRLARKAARTCVSCLALDGTIYQTSYEFAEHPAGRCALLPIVEGAPVPQWETDGERYFGRLPESEQRKRLGKERFELYKSGVTLRDMVEIRENPTWGGDPRLISVRLLSSGSYNRPLQPFEVIPRREFEERRQAEERESERQRQLQRDRAEAEKRLQRLTKAEERARREAALTPEQRAEKERKAEARREKKEREERKAAREPLFDRLKRILGEIEAKGGEGARGVELWRKYGEDDLSKMLGARDVQARIRKEIEAHVKRTQTPPLLDQRHGMKKAQEFRSFEAMGLRFNFTKTTKAAAIKSAERLFWETEFGGRATPPRVLATSKGVFFVSERCKNDSYWAKKYNMPRLRTFATGGDGNIVVYSKNVLPARTLAHESGHNFATLVYGTTSPPPSSEWYTKAWQGAEQPVRTYGTKSIAEDFATAVEHYVQFGSASMAQSHPIRHALLERLFSTGKE